MALARRAREHAEALLDDAGGLPASEAALARELQHGWLERVWAGDPASGARPVDETIRACEPAR